MKRMIDLKDYEETKKTAQEAKEEAQNAQADIDRLSQVYTYATLEIEDGYFDMIDPASTVPDQGPVNLAIGDTIYIDGEATTLNSEKIAELFDANNLVLKCGNDPTHYPTVILQRQYIDNAAAGIDESSARFESFVTLNSKVYHYTLNATRYDETTELGGAILIACTEAHVKPIYCHPVTIRSTNGSRLSCLIFNNNVQAFTISSFISYIKNFDGRILFNGTYVDTSKIVNSSYIVYTSSNDTISLIGNLTSNGENYNSSTPGNLDFGTFMNSLTSDLFSDNVNKIN